MDSEIILKKCSQCGTEINVPLKKENLKRTNLDVRCSKSNCQGFVKVVYDEEGQLSPVRFDILPDGSIDATPMFIEKT